MRVRLLRGSVEDILPTLDAESFDASLCDPPYGLSFMGKAWDHGVPGAAIWAEVERCLRPGAHLLAFGGTRTFHRLTVGIEDGGFEIRDCLAWLYGSGFPKSLDVSKAIDAALGETREVVGVNPNGGRRGSSSFGQIRTDGSDVAVTAPAAVEAKAWSGYGTALKPAWEPCILAMKPTAGTFAANALAHGVAGLAIDAGRIACDSKAWGSGNRDSWRESEGRADRQTERYGEADQNPSGRWPANVLLDEEAAQVLDAQSGHMIDGDDGRRNGVANVTLHGLGARAEPWGGYGGEGGASRFFYTAKADRAERQGSRHPTLKPMDLCAYLARLLLPPVRSDGKPRRILVPFSGAGSEMIGCLRAGWDEVVGIERETEYVADAERRIRAEFGLLVEMERAS